MTAKLQRFTPAGSESLRIACILEKNISDAFSEDEILSDGCKPKNLESVLNELMKVGEKDLLGKNVKVIPLTTIMKLLDIVNKEELQVEYKLLREISRACRLYSTIIITRLSMMSRGIRASTREKYRKIAKSVRRALPKEEVSTRFNLRCCKAMWQMTEGNSEKVRGLVNNELRTAGEGVASFNAGKAASAVFTAIKKRFSTDSKLRWFPSAVQLHINTFGAIEGKFEALHAGVKKHHTSKKIKNGWGEDERVALALVDGLESIIRNSTNPNNRTSAIFSKNENSPSFSYFSRFKVKRKIKGKDTEPGWKVRFRTIELMIEFFNDKKVTEKEKSLCFSVIKNRVMKEGKIKLQEANRRVQHLILRFYDATGNKHKDMWGIFQTTVEKSLVDHKNERENHKEKLTKNSDERKEVQKKIKGNGENRLQSGNRSDSDEEPDEKIKKLKKVEEKLNQELKQLTVQDSLLSAEEELLKRMKKVAPLTNTKDKHEGKGDKS